MNHLLEKLSKENKLSKEDWSHLLTEQSLYEEKAAQMARDTANKSYRTSIYIRGLIEVSNYCKNDCYYCGIRKSNEKLSRYRLSKEDILSCCLSGYELGFRTFVLQGGEDGFFSEEKWVDIISTIRTTYPDCAITLSLGEWPKNSLQAFYNAGANRYLLRHETANANHYQSLHPAGLTLENRKKCLYFLKEIGYQVGTGFMVGSPGQTTECLIEDLLFLSKLQPDMVGIGPFIPHRDTPFGNQSAGSYAKTLYLLSLIRLLLPQVLLPATTALGTIHKNGREAGILAGANVIMPNLSPQPFRKLYSLYDNKLCTGDETAEYLKDLEKRINAIGYQINKGRGDVIYRSEEKSKHV